MGRTPLDFEWKLFGLMVFEIKRERNACGTFSRQHTERHRKTQTGIIAWGHYKRVLSQTKELLDESFCFSSHFVLHLSLPLLRSPSRYGFVPRQPVGDVAGLASSVWLSIWQMGGKDTHKLCLHPNIVFIGNDSVWN